MTKQSNICTHRSHPHSNHQWLFSLGRVHSTFQYCRSYPEGWSFQASTSWISPCSTTQLYGVFTNRVLPLSSGRKPKHLLYNLWPTTPTPKKITHSWHCAFLLVCGIEYVWVEIPLLDTTYTCIYIYCMYTHIYTYIQRYMCIKFYSERKEYFKLQGLLSLPISQLISKFKWTHSRTAMIMKMLHMLLCVGSKVTKITAQLCDYA